MLTAKEELEKSSRIIRCLRFSNLTKFILYVNFSLLLPCSLTTNDARQPLVTLNSTDMSNIYLLSNGDGALKDEFNRSHLYLMLAQEEAKCLKEFGELKPTVSLEFPQDFFRPFVCLAGSQNYIACEQCIQVIREKRVGLNIPTSSVDSRRDEATGGRDTYKTTLTTNVFCEGALSRTQTTSGSLQTQTNRQTDQDKSNYGHFVYLKSLLSDGVNETMAEMKLPMVLVIEQRELVGGASGTKLDLKRQWTGWRALEKSSYGFDKVNVAYGQQTYQWRVTAVGIHGPLAVSIVKPFETLDGYKEPGPPRRVFVIENKPGESTADVLIGWEPPQERACFYKIVLETRTEVEPARTVRIKGEPLGVHKVWFQDLKFGSTYEVRITSRSAEWDEDESTHASLCFTTPLCLDAHQFRFDKCAPPPPRNLSYTVDTVMDIGSSKVFHVLGKVAHPFKRHFTAHLKWEPPAYVSPTNLIESYVVDVRAFSWVTHHDSKKKSKHTVSILELLNSKDVLAPLLINLPGNVTQVKVDNLDVTAEYTVLVSAVSSKGSSPAATLAIKLQTDVGLSHTSVSLWVYPCGVVVAILLVGLVIHAVKRIRTRLKINGTRSCYLKSTEQRDAFTGDWSVESLTEDLSSTWTVLEENYFPKDKWHVDVQDLTIGDIIGRGAFGIVRKAAINSDKYLELLKRHNRKSLDIHYQMCKTELGNDETGIETVALKMLRVAATTAEREDLIKELMTMQSLGTHPQIVTLLGICTTGNSMHLVLEYCSGGDLLSFLRQFREKHLSLFNLDCQSMKGTWCENTEDEIQSCEGKFVKGNSIETGDEWLDVCQTDFHQNELFPCSQRLLGNRQGAAKKITETETSRHNNEDKTTQCSIITEKDVLSYARQIALGMAYLERNHIIHRDLACRNILVMDDYKRVKISDFGLSRDIYTSSVYEPKTAGKMPFKWMALESIATRVFTSKSDVWSYGIVLWEIATFGAVPYPALENQELLNLLRQGYRMERPDNCSEELYSMMRKCWRTGPADRPKFTELILYLEAMMDTEPELYLTLHP